MLLEFTPRTTGELENQAAFEQYLLDACPLANFIGVSCIGPAKWRVFIGAATGDRARALHAVIGEVLTNSRWHAEDIDVVLFRGTSRT
jgi:hypothetical protein